MRQLLVECSDPGVVVSLAEEFENVLRGIDFDRARTLKSQLRELSRELGPEIDYTRRRLGLSATCGEGFVRINLDGTRESCRFPTCEFRS